MIPKTIQPYFKITQQIEERDNSIIEGVLTCCDAHDFEVYVVGKIKRNMFSKMYLYPQNDKIVFEVRCKNAVRLFRCLIVILMGMSNVERIPLIHVYLPKLLIAYNVGAKVFPLQLNMNIQIFKNSKNLE